MNIPTGHAYVEFTDSESATKAEKYMNGGIASLLSLLPYSHLCHINY